MCLYPCPELGGVIRAQSWHRQSIKSPSLYKNVQDNWVILREAPNVAPNPANFKCREMKQDLGAFWLVGRGFQLCFCSCHCYFIFSSSQSNVVQTRHLECTEHILQCQKEKKGK